MYFEPVIRNFGLLSGLLFVCGSTETHVELEVLRFYDSIILQYHICQNCQSTSSHLLSIVLSLLPTTGCKHELYFFASFHTQTGNAMWQCETDLQIEIKGKAQIRSRNGPLFYYHRQQASCEINLKLKMVTSILKNGSEWYIGPLDVAHKSTEGRRGPGYLQYQPRVTLMKHPNRKGRASGEFNFRTLSWMDFCKETAMDLYLWVMDSSHFCSG